MRQVTSVPSASSVASLGVSASRRRTLAVLSSAALCLRGEQMQALYAVTSVPSASSVA